MTFLYPPEKRIRAAGTGANFNNVPDQEALPGSAPTDTEGKFKSRFLVVLDRLEHLPGMMALAQLVQPAQALMEATAVRNSVDEKGKHTFFDNLKKKSKAYMHQLLAPPQNQRQGATKMRWEHFVKVSACG